MAFVVDRFDGDEFPAPTAGQTVFELSAAPSDPGDVTFELNGLGYNQDYFTLVGTTLTYTDDVDVPIEVGDVVVVYYDSDESVGGRVVGYAEDPT